MSTQAESVTQSDVDRLPLDIERIHELAEALLPVSEQIDAGLPVEDRKLNAKLVELIAILHELHPADVAGLLESLPQKERALVWHLAAPEEDGEVLLEVSDAVRETLIETSKNCWLRWMIWMPTNWPNWPPICRTKWCMKR